jgi:multisubunit Na+/H+ antiporter MnhB subunit
MEEMMEVLITLFDLILIATMLWVAWQALTTKALFKSIVLFIVFGLLVSLAWVRLNAPDIALAEAAIGSGLTGALLLSALGRMRGLERNWEKQESANKKNKRTSIWLQESVVSSPPSSFLNGVERVALRILIVVLAVTLFGAVLSLPITSPGLTTLTIEALPQSGVKNPVTAVLLNIRGYDTLLEVAILLLAAVGVWAFSRRTTGHYHNPHSDVLLAFVRFILPIMVIVSGYLVWIGADNPGGAFQAGAVLGSAGMLWLLSEIRRSDQKWIWLQRIGVSIGLATFILVAVIMMVLGLNFLEYPLELAKPLILIIEVGATLSIGIILASLFLGAHPGSEGDPLPLEETYTQAGNEDTG